MLTSWIRRTVVEAGGRTWLVGPPTLGAVLLLLEEFAIEVYALAKAAKELDVEADPIETMLPAFLDPGRLGPVLVEVAVGPSWDDRKDRQLLAEASPEDLAQLARASLRLCDLRRVIEFLGLDRIAEREPDDLEEAPEEDGPSDQELAVLALASRFGVSPHEILRWPIDEFITAVEGVPMLAGGAGGREGGALRADSAPLSALALAGADVSPPPEA